jgi:hypothetical protein
MEALPPTSGAVEPTHASAEESPEEALPPRPVQSEGAEEAEAPKPDEGAWFLVDNGGALAFRSAPDMDRKTTAIAHPRELVYAAEHQGDWIRTREDLWLPKQFLLPLTGQSVTPEDAEEAHEAHRRVAETAAAAPDRAPQLFQPSWYRVDQGGGVAFRKSPSMDDRTTVAARAGELVFILEQSAEHPDWMKTEEGLWLPARFLAPLANESDATQAELELARLTHRAAAHAHYMETAEGWETSTPQGQLTGIGPDAPQRPSSSPLKSPLKSLQAKGGKLKHKLERHDAEPEPSELLDSTSAVSVLAGCRAEITSIDREVESKPKRGGKHHYTVFVIHCTGTTGNEWTIKRRFRQFRDFRERLMRHGAPQLKDIRFPRKKVRNGKQGTDRERLPVLQSWLNLVISVFSSQLDVAPFIAHFLDAEQRQKSTGVMKVGEIGEPVDASRLCGEWHAMGMNRYRSDAIEHERFVLEVDETASAAGSCTVVVGRNVDSGAPESFRIEQVVLQQRPATGLYLSFQQVYPDDTKTNWTCQLDERCRSMTNGVWTALSGKYKGSVVGNFSASVHGAMGCYKVISIDGCLVRSGAEKTTDMLHTLAPGEVIEVTDMVRLDSGVQRYFFARADLELQGWVSAQKEDGTPLLEMLPDGEDDEESEPMLEHMMHSVAHALESAEHSVTHAVQSAEHTVHQAVDHIHHSEESVRKFLTDAAYREHVIGELRHDLEEDVHKISQEIGESQEMMTILVAYAEGHPLTADEKDRAVDQLLDICKVIPALGVFLLPGGAVFLPMLAKILPFSILPSAFADDEAASGTAGNAFSLTVCQSEATAGLVGEGGVQVFLHTCNLPANRRLVFGRAARILAPVPTDVAHIASV